MKKLMVLLTYVFTLQTAFAQDTAHRAQAIYYGKMARQQYVNENLDSALVLNRKALRFDSTLSWIQFNNALFYFARRQGDPVQNYLKALTVNEHAPDGKQALSNAIIDLDEAQQKYGPVIDYDMVKQILIDRYNRYP